ncbi:hypothetical protein D3C87_1243490 [compost metagenome]
MTFMRVVTPANPNKFTGNTAFTALFLFASWTNPWISWNSCTVASSPCACAPVCNCSRSPSLIGEAAEADSCRLANAVLTSTVAPL